MESNGTSGASKHVVILGAGFGGLYAALEFEKRLAAEKNLRVTLVNQDNFFLFTPMLHEVAASDLNVRTIVNPIRRMLKRVDFFKGDVQRIDLKERAVVVSHGLGHQHTFAYDHLVLAMGAVTNFFNLPGLQERALGMKSVGDAVALRNHLIDCLEEADFECSAGERDWLMTIVVAGGGFSGVETMGAINDFLRAAIRSYRHLHEKNLRVVLVHPGPYLLPELGEKLGRYAQKKLAERRVEILLNTRVVTVTAEAVQLSNGASITTKSLVWTAGTTPSPLLGTLGCAKDRGRVVVDEFLAAPGWPGVWAVGDCAAIPDKKTGKLCPPTAQYAYRQGPQVARNILASLHGQSPKPFIYSTLGQMAAIGHRTGVALVFGFSFSGFIAWWLWRTVYLLKLPRLEKKIRVTLEWTLDMLFSRDLAQFTVRRAPTISEPAPPSSTPEQPTAAAAK